MGMGAIHSVNQSLVVAMGLELRVKNAMMVTIKMEMDVHHNV